MPTGNGETEKKSVPIYNGNTSNEVYLQMLNKLSVLLKSHPEMKQERDAANTINSFRYFLRGAPKENFNGTITIPAIYLIYVADARTLTTDIMGPTALRDKLAYLRRTPKPNSLTIEKWINRIEAINTLLPHFQENTNQRSTEQLAKEVIIPNIPHYLRDDFELSYRTGDSLRQMCSILTLISNKTKKAFDAAKKGGHNHSDNDKKQNGGVSKNNGNGKNYFENECKIHGGHKWMDCYQNPANSRNRDKNKDCGRSTRRHDHHHTRRSRRNRSTSRSPSPCSR